MEAAVVGLLEHFVPPISDVHQIYGIEGVAQGLDHGAHPDQVLPQMAAPAPQKEHDRQGGQKYQHIAHQHLVHPSDEGGAGHGEDTAPAVAHGGREIGAGLAIKIGDVLAVLDVKTAPHGLATCLDLFRGDIGEGGAGIQQVIVFVEQIIGAALSQVQVPVTMNKVFLMQVEQHGIARLGGDSGHHHLVDMLDGADEPVGKDHFPRNGGGLGVPYGVQIAIVVGNGQVGVIDKPPIHGQRQRKLRVAQGVRGDIHIAEQAAGDLLHGQALVGELV